MICKIDVKNVPEYAEHRRYIVATLADGILGFYGATDSPEKALEMEREFPEHRVTVERIER
jgi:hypothetical protein